MSNVTSTPATGAADSGPVDLRDLRRQLDDIMERIERLAREDEARDAR